MLRPSKHQPNPPRPVRPQLPKIHRFDSAHHRLPRMAAIAPFCVPTSGYANAPASRLASTIRTDSPHRCRIGILGLADDLGVRLNNGRPGAAAAPDAIRAALCKYGVNDPHGWDYPTIFDAGNIIPAPGSDAAALAETHSRVTEATSWMIDQGLLPIGIGGGHDLTFPFVRATINRSCVPLTHGLYFDAHLDVRESPGSGMPFRKLIEACGIRSLQLMGFNPFVNSREHAAWFLAHGGVMTDSPASIFAHATSPMFVSLDMDVLDSAHAPGVSALNPAGLTPAQLAPLVELAGACPWVACFDLMEHCPVHDVEGRTARVAAHLLLSFLCGVAHRPGGAC